jgi:hypothetical protein
MLNTFNKGGWMTPTTYWRPQVLWMPMGGLLGALAGALTGTVLLLATTLVESRAGAHEDLWESVVFVVVAGPWFGGIAGLVVGLCVGVEMMFLVGAHLPRDVARRRAYALGFALPPVTMLVAVVLLSGGEVSLGAGAPFWVVTFVGASLLGGPLARWLAGFQPPRPRAEP